MPLIGNEVFNFVKIWNPRAIRPQKGCPKRPTGSPYLICQYTPSFPEFNVQDYGLTPDPSVLIELAQDVKEFGKYFLLYMN